MEEEIKNKKPEIEFSKQHSVRNVSLGRKNRTTVTCNQLRMHPYRMPGEPAFIPFYQTILP
jgi:hypothetical protein